LQVIIYRVRQAPCGLLRDFRENTNIKRHGKFY
jgi:hypothetical protein